MPEPAESLYLRAAMSLVEPGWRIAADSDPRKGRVVLVHTDGERIEYRRRYSRGDPVWFPEDYPVRLGSSLPEPFLAPRRGGHRVAGEL